MSDIFGGLVGLGFMVASFAAWGTHLWVCFNNAEWGFLIAGALFFPVAMIHGVGTWFNWW